MSILELKRKYEQLAEKADDAFEELKQKLYPLLKELQWDGVDIDAVGWYSVSVSWGRDHAAEVDLPSGIWTSPDPMAVVREFKIARDQQDLAKKKEQAARDLENAQRRLDSLG